MRYLLFILLSCSFLSEAQSQDLPHIAIIIDDMGNHLALGKTAMRLPKAITFAFLPYAPHTNVLVKQAQQQGHDVILHLPMESIHDYPLDQGGLTRQMEKKTFIRVLNNSLDRIPNIVGVNNHMGSRLTQIEQPMHWLMQELKKRPLFFVDSKTSVLSIAEETAATYHIPTRTRDIFLDNNRDTKSVLRQFQHLIRIAKKKGSALAIGHPYASTLAVLHTQLPKMSGVTLVSVNDLIHQGRKPE